MRIQTDIPALRSIPKQPEPIRQTIRQNGRKNFLYAYWKNRYLVLLFLPAVIYYAVFHYGPMYGIQIAFRNYYFTKGIWGSPWAGLKYFDQLIHMTGFWNVFENTVIISGLKLLFGFPAPILFAIFLNEISFLPFKKMVQTISYLPHFLSWIIIASLFIQFLAPTTGPVNIALGALGVKQIYFMADPHWYRTMLVVTEIWKSIGWGSIVYLAALTGINPELYEACSIDGAKTWQKMCYVTLPEMTPVITIMLIFAVGNLINDDFDQVYNTLNDAVLNVGDVISTYVYRMGLVNMQYSFSTAVGLFKNIIAFTMIVITNTITKRINEYGIW